MELGERSENNKLQEQPARRPSQPDRRGRSPLGASDDNIQASQVCPSQQSRQSILCKLTRAEGSNPQTTTKKELDETECDTTTISGLKNQTTITDLEGSSSLQRNSNKNNVDPPTTASLLHQKDKKDEQSDDDNQVIPLWPSKAEAASRCHDFVQHKVYSLKDYSQVASPTGPTIMPARASEKKQTSSSSRKLLKSMSQERKMLKGAAAKRMSECIYPPSAASHLGQQSMDANSGLPSIQSQPRGSYSGRGNKPTGVEHHLMAGESRIDRMRKLFVSPLSLRSGHHHQQMNQGRSSAGALQNPRLSIQSTGESMLNKPHHLMHAMYRHHNQRRSPMRGQLNSGKAGKSFRVYGCPLQLANNIYPITCFGRADIYKQQSVPYVLARLCNYIEENSCKLTHEGIFRVSGNARLMEKLRTLFDHLGDAPLESESVDVATSASMLKMYLRELPEPLIPTRMNYYFIALAKKYSLYLASEQMNSSGANHHGGLYHSAKQQLLTGSSNIAASVTTNSSEPSTSGDSGTQAAINTSNSAKQSLERQRLAFSRDLTKLLRKLPIENYNLLKYLACFLYRISLKQKYNKMCSEALGIVFGPNIFRIRSESYKGLKKQELSNQIMASIISNYKSIFDSEVTDPLGNLVDLSSADLGPEGLAETGQQQMATASPTCETGVEKAEQVQASSPIALPSPADETSSAQTVERSASKPQTRSQRGHSSCCKEHCPNYLLNDEAQYSELHYVDDEQDDDDCDGESYTPSTGSGSYCSSMDSESLESLYGDNLGDGLDSDEHYYDEEGEEGDDDLEDDIDMISRSDSSSECASDTSYTPTSSHTDENDLGTDEQPDKRSNADKGASSELDLRMPKSASDNRQDSCLVCKRRQSLVNGPTDKSPSVSHPTANTYTGHRSVRSRRRHNKGKLRIPRTTAGQASLVVELKEQSQEDASVKTTPATAGQVRTGKKSPRFFRRRSSSASSLGRVRHKRDQLAVQQKHLLEEEIAPGQQSKAVLRTSTGERPVRRRTRHLSVHRSQGVSSLRGHRSCCQHEVHSRSMVSGRMSSARTKRESDTCKQQVTPPRAATADELLNCSSLRQRDGLETTESEEFFAPWANYLSDLDFDRYCLMRSFNSDETLLRSFNYCSEFANSAAGEQLAAEGTTKYNTQQKQRLNQASRRRFSGYETVDRPADSLVQMCPPCGQIHEAYEEDIAALEAEASDAPMIGQPRQPVPQHSELTSSYVSLLDSRLNSLSRKSDHSIQQQQPPASQEDLQTAQDAVLSQMKATKDLIRALRRLLKRGSSYKDYTASMESLIMGLSEDPATRASAYSDDPSSCYVDHLAARGLVERLDGLSLDEDELSGSVRSPEQLTRLERLNGLLSIKITLFKQRYNDLKSIHDHYMQNHFQQTPNVQHELNNELDGRVNNPVITSVIGQTSGHWKFHGSLDTLQGYSMSTGSISSGRQPSHRTRKLSVPNKRALAPFGASMEPTAISQQQPRYSTNNDQCRPSVSGGHVGASVRSPAVNVAKNRHEEQQQTRLHKLAHQMTQSANCSASSVDKQLASTPTTVAAQDGGCKYGLLCPIEFVFNIEKQLASKRISAGRLVKLTEMSVEQLQAEKLELQKNLLRYEHWFGRPVTRLEFGLVGHLYERYRAVKLIKQRKLEATSEIST